MIYKNAHGTNIIKFETGDIEVGNGRALLYNEKESLKRRLKCI